MKILCFLFAVVLIASAQEPLTNDSIVKMVKGGLGEDLVLTMIRNQPGKYSLSPDSLVKLKQQGVSEKLLAAMVSKGSANAAPGGNVINQPREQQQEPAVKVQNKAPERGVSLPPARGAAPAGSAASNNTFFVTWRDPKENAFQVGVPQGWQISGGLTRASQIEPHSLIRAQSPDGKIQIFYDDPDLNMREVPDQLTQFAGFREGQTMPAAWGGKVLLARYLTGAQFAQQYIRAKVCPQAEITESSDLRDASALMNTQIRPYAAQQRSMAQASVGESSFRCRGASGYVMANTFYARPAAGPGPTLWYVYQMGGYKVTDPQQAGLAYYVLNTMLETLKVDPAWEAQESRKVQDVTGAVTKMQQAMSQSIAAYGQRQASAASAGGFNHPNSGELPTDLRKKWATEDESRQKFSDATLGQTWVHSSTGANVRVDNSSTNWWRDYSGNVVAGPESGGPPPGSQGQYERLQSGWQQ